jgi:hypothetical protein
MTAHVGAVPVEELVAALASAGTGLAVLRAWIAIRVGATAARIRSQSPPWGGGGSAAASPPPVR